MQKNIKEAQARRRKEALRSALISSLILAATGGGLLGLSWYHGLDGFWGAVVRIIAILELGAIIPVWILLKTRFKEIEGGEEDAAAQY